MSHTPHLMLADVVRLQTSYFVTKINIYLPTEFSSDKTSNKCREENNQQLVKCQTVTEYRVT